MLKQPSELWPSSAQVSQVKGPHLFPSETCAGRVHSKHRNQRENIQVTAPQCTSHLHGLERAGPGPSPPSEMHPHEGASKGKTWLTQWVVLRSLEAGEESSKGAPSSCTGASRNQPHLGEGLVVLSTPKHQVWSL